MADVEKAGEAVLELSTDAKKLLEGIKQAKVTSAGLESHFRDVASSINGILASIGVGLSIGAFVNATVEAENAQVLLGAAIRATGGAAGFTTAQLVAQATVLQGLTAVSDENIMAAQRSLLMFRNVRGEAFREATKLALDLSVAMETDAASAARTLGMALNAPADGLDRLRRSGIMVNAQTREQIETLSEHGRIAEAQALLLGAVASSYSGLAKASRDTFGGALKNLKNVIEDYVLEIDGPFLTSMKNMVNAISSWVPEAMPVFSAAWAGLKVVVENAMEIIFMALDGLIKLIRGEFRQAWESMKDSVGLLNDPLRGLHDAVTTAYTGTKTAMEGMKASTEALAVSAPKVTQAYEDFSKKTKSNTDSVKSAIESLQRTTANSVGDMAAKFALGKTSFESFAKSVVTHMIQMGIQMQILKAMGPGFMGSFFSGFAGTGGGGFFGGVMGAASGARITGPTPLIAGEGGEPETVVPDSQAVGFARGVLASDGGSGGGGVNQEINVNITGNAGGLDIQGLKHMLVEVFRSEDFLTVTTARRINIMAERNARRAV